MKYCYNKKEGLFVVINRGKTYSTYAGAITKYGNLKKYEYEYCPVNGKLCIKIWFGFDATLGCNVYILETTDGCHQFTIGSDGVEIRASKVLA